MLLGGDKQLRYRACTFSGFKKHQCHTIHESINTYSVPVRYAVPLMWGQPTPSNHLQSSPSRWWTAKGSWSCASTAAETAPPICSPLDGTCNTEVPAGRRGNTDIRHRHIMPEWQWLYAPHCLWTFCICQPHFTTSSSYCQEIQWLMTADLHVVKKGHRYIL